MQQRVRRNDIAAQGGKGNDVALFDAARHVLDAASFPRRTDDRRAIFADQFRVAADMILVVMGVENKREIKIAFLERVQHHIRVARVHNHGQAKVGIADEVDIIVRESGQYIDGEAHSCMLYRVVLKED